MQKQTKPTNSSKKRKTQADQLMVSGVEKKPPKEKKLPKQRPKTINRVESQPDCWEVIEEEGDMHNVQIGRGSSLSVHKVLAANPPKPIARTIPEMQETPNHLSPPAIPRRNSQRGEQQAAKQENSSILQGHGFIAERQDKNQKPWVVRNSHKKVGKGNNNMDLEMDQFSLAVDNSKTKELNQSTSVRFHDRIESSLNNPRMSNLSNVESKAKKAGILKISKDLFNQTQQIDAPQKYLSNNLNISVGKADTNPESLLAKTLGSIHHSVVFNLQENSIKNEIETPMSSPQSKPKSKRAAERSQANRINEEVEEFERREADMRKLMKDPDNLSLMSGTIKRENSHWAGLTGLPGMGVPVGGKKFKPGEKQLNENAVKDAMLRIQIEKGLVEPRHKGKYAYRNVMESIEEDYKHDINLFMQNIVYKYTRKTIEESRAQREQERREVEEYANRKPHHQGDYRPEILTTHDYKMRELMKKSRKPIDFNEIEQKQQERAWRKFERYDEYKIVAGTMVFSEEQFQNEIKMHIDFSKSPMPPAQFVKKKLIDQPTQARGSSWNPDPYTLELGQVDEFLPKADANLYNDSAVEKQMKTEEDEAERKMEMERKRKEKEKREQRNRYKHKTVVKRSNTRVDIVEVNDQEDKVSVKVPRSEKERHSLENSEQGLVGEKRRKRSQILKLPIQKQETKDAQMGTSVSEPYDEQDLRRSNPNQSNGDSILDSPLPDEVAEEKFKALEDNYSDMLSKMDQDLEALPIYLVDIDEKKEEKQLVKELVFEGPAIFQYEKGDIMVDYEIRNDNPNKNKDMSEQDQINMSMAHRDTMKNAEKVFKVVREYCKDQLNISYNMLDKHIEELLDPKATVSPLLKYFNELARFSNFRLPCRALLEFDQRFFKKFVARLRAGHQMQLQWLQQQVVKAARETLRRGFDDARALLIREIKHVLAEYETVSLELKKQIGLNFNLKDNLDQQEMVIGGLRSYVNAKITKDDIQEDELAEINMGRGGKIIQDFEAFYTMLQELAQKTAKEIGENIMKNQKELFRSPKKRLDVARESLNNFALSKHSVQSFYKQADDDTNRKETNNSRISSDRNSPSKTFTELAQKFLPNKTEAMYMAEPMLKKQFNLFGGHISLSAEDKQSIFAQEMYQHQRIEINRLKAAIEQLQAENLASNQVMREYKFQNDKLVMDNEHLKSVIATHEREMKEFKEQVQIEAELEIEKVRSQTEHRMQQLKEFMDFEVELSTHIKDRIVGENKMQAEKLRKFATLLRIPRLHFDYIEKHGVNEFVEFCEKVVRRERAIIESKKSKEKTLELRNDFSVLKLKKRMQDESDRYQSNRIDLTIKQPFQMELYVDDQRRDDHPDHHKTSSNQGVLKQNQVVSKKLEEINWLKNKSVLELGDLIKEHLDKQPQLLAMLQPEVKSALLYNPILLKNLEQLERQDPINIKVKQVRNFISQLKQDTFGSFSQATLQKQMPAKDQVRLRNQLCKSVAVDGFSTLQHGTDESNLLIASTRMTQNTLNKASVFESQSFHKKIGIEGVRADKINNFIENMESAVSQYKSKLMLENMKGVRLNDQSDANLNSNLFQSAFKQETSHRDSHLRALQDEDAINGMVDSVSSRLMANSKLQKSNNLTTISVSNRMMAGRSPIQNHTQLTSTRNAKYLNRSIDFSGNIGSPPNYLNLDRITGTSLLQTPESNRLFLNEAKQEDHSNHRVLIDILPVKTDIQRTNATSNHLPSISKLRSVAKSNLNTADQH